MRCRWVKGKTWCKSCNSTKVINSDSKIGWGGFLPFWYLNCFGALVKDTRFSGRACGTSSGQRSPAPPTILHRLHWPTLLSRISNVKAITSWKKTTNGSNCRVIGHHEGEFEDSVQAAHKIKHLPPGRPNIDQKYQFEVSSLFRSVNMRSQPMAITKHFCLLSTLCSPIAAFQAFRSSSNKNMSWMQSVSFWNTFVEVKPCLIAHLT